MASSEKSALSQAVARVRDAGRVLRGKRIVLDPKASTAVPHKPVEPEVAENPVAPEEPVEAGSTFPELETTGRTTIVDVGMHKGQDAEHYRRRGFRVVCFEANPALCARATKMFSDLKADAIEIRNLAICDSDETEVALYINNKLDEWSSLDRDLGERQFGATKTIVPAGNLTKELSSIADDILYAKIDIEGLDEVALAQILELPVPPSYVSVENGSLSMFDRLRDAGYDGFKFSNQKYVQGQAIPYEPKHGVYSDHIFEFGASGLFGEDLHGYWLSFEDAVKMQKALLYAASQESAPNQFAEVIGWFDLHARHSSVG